MKKRRKKKLKFDSRKEWLVLEPFNNRHIVHSRVRSYAKAKLIASKIHGGKVKHDEIE